MALNTSTLPYTTGSTTSADGTTIGYRQIGSGPGLLLLPGGFQASQHYMRLATALASAFTVSVLDRRGRGLSGPHGDQYCMTKECEDVDALLTETGAHFVFGHSSGGLIALQAALTLSSVRKVAVYEPPLSQHGSISTSWIPRFDREIAEGKPASALITFIKGDNLSRLPRWLLLPLIKWYVQKEKQTLGPNDISMEELIPTQRFDGLLVKEMDGSLESFSGMRADVLLLGGAKSPAFLRDVLDALNHTLPHVKWIEYPDFDHSAPNQSRPNHKGPERIAGDLRAFFRQS
jgi:pimeloyl-ACP methyl ester carboxylesterase